MNLEDAYWITVQRQPDGKEVFSGDGHAFVKWSDANPLDLRYRLSAAEQEVARLMGALERVRGGLCYPDEYFKVANDALQPRSEPQECSICRRRHGNEIQHPCE